MTLFVVYQHSKFKAVKEFDRPTEAIKFAEEKGGKIYYEKEGVRYPDEDKEKTAHLKVRKTVKM